MTRAFRARRPITTPCENDSQRARRLADSLQRNIVGALFESGYQTRDRGVKSDLLAGKPYGHFFSLRGPVPSVLVEALFLSNAADPAFSLTKRPSKRSRKATLEESRSIWQAKLRPRRWRFSALARTASRTADTQDHQHRLEDDVAGHLGLANPAVDEDDRHLGKSVAAPAQEVIDLDLEGVAVRADAVRFSCAEHGRRST